MICFELRICVGWDGADKKKMKTSFDLEPVRWIFEYGVGRVEDHTRGMLSKLSCFRDLRASSHLGNGRSCDMGAVVMRVSLNGGTPNSHPK